MPQLPDVERFKQLYLAQDYAPALDVLEQLIKASPGAAPLYWHQANCLEKLERHAEIPFALNHLIERKPDYVPALVKRAEYSDWLLEGMDEETPQHKQKKAELDAQKEKDLRYALELEPNHAQACFLLANLLRYGTQQPETNGAVQAEAKNLLDKAIALSADNVEYLLSRAEIRRGDAIVDLDLNDDGSEKPLDPTCVQTLTGMRYRRATLEAAVADYEKCWQLSQEPRYAVKLGTALHDLGRYDEALQRYDEALALFPADDPRRDYIQEMRARSENNGAGEREQVARMLLGGLDTESGKNRTHQDHMAAQAIIGAAEAIRRGESVSTAVANNISDDPDTMSAMNIARQILNVANEPPPGLVAVNAKDFPAYQRRHSNKASRQAAQLGLTTIADAEARAMFNMLGQHVLLRLFRNDSGDIGLASFVLKPKWPGILGFINLLISGKWKERPMIECLTQFDDGALITTQPESISPFQWGGKIMIQKLPATASAADIYQKHSAAVAEYRKTHPDVRPMLVTNLEEAEKRWVAGQESKAAYRKSIGYVTEEELQKMLGKHYDRFAEKVRTQIRLMAP